MKAKIFSLLLTGAMLIAQVPEVVAQNSLQSWSTVQAVATDDRLIIRQKDGKTLEGDMIEATDTNLTISRGKKVVHISRSDIQSIFHSKGKAAKAKWALIGAGVGAGTGAGVGALKHSPTIDDSEILILIGFVFGAGIGAVTGALFGASRRNRTLIYQAP